MGKIRLVGDVSRKEFQILEETSGELKVKNASDNVDLLTADSTTIKDAGGVALNAHADRHKQGGADEVVGIVLQGADANKPAAGVAGRFWLSTDTLAFYYDDGTAWNLVGVLAGLDLSAHATRHNRGGADAIDWSALSKYLNKSATGVAIGVAGSPASILRVDLEANYYNLVPKMIRLTPAGLGTGESVTYHVIFYFSDGTSAEVATPTGVTGATTLTDADLDWSLIPDLARITAIEVTAESSATATTATSDATIVALEL